MVQVKGSDTMVNLAQAWAERYQAENPGANTAVTGGGSGTGITSLVQGAADIAQSSRKIKPEEIELASQRGIHPQQFEVAIDALAVIIHPSNKIDRLTIDQLSDIYSRKISNWKQLGGADEEIVLLSRDMNSGSHVFFLEAVVRRGNSKGPEQFAPEALMMPSSEAIANQVAIDEGSIGYVGLGYYRPGRQKTVAVAASSEGPYVQPGVSASMDGSYPIARPLYWYTDGAPAGDLKRFLEFVLSPTGQTVVSELGFAPVRSPK